MSEGKKIFLCDDVLKSDVKDDSTMTEISQAFASILSDKEINRSLVDTTPLSWDILRSSAEKMKVSEIPLDKMDEFLEKAERKAGQTVVQPKEIEKILKINNVLKNIKLGDLYSKEIMPHFTSVPHLRQKTPSNIST